MKQKTGLFRCTELLKTTTKGDKSMAVNPWYWNYPAIYKLID
jgi:hypothetical protein|tara:strand:+ start:418 stop:543 length:126 start_codon:yes stop_codon:yes gene_type:complete